MKVYIDTEFTSLLARHPKLISIGLITEDGSRTFYAEIQKHYRNVDCSLFVVDEVLPLLDAPELPAQINYQNVYAKMTHDECRIHLGYWIASLMDPVSFLTDAPSYDWPLVQHLFDGHPWPAMLDSQPVNCYLPVKIPMTERIFDAGNYRRHHALDDAKVMRLVYQ